MVMMDPPWDLGQDLRHYDGIVRDDEMRKMNIGCLQDDGVIFLWVTGQWAPRV